MDFTSRKCYSTCKMLIASDSKKNTSCDLWRVFQLSLVWEKQKLIQKICERQKVGQRLATVNPSKQPADKNHPLHVVWCSMYNNTVILHVVAYETGIRQSDLLISFDQTVSLCLTATKFISKSSQVLLIVSYCFLWQASWQFLLLAASGPAFCADP